MTQNWRTNETQKSPTIVTEKATIVTEKVIFKPYWKSFPQTLIKTDP